MGLPVRPRIVSYVKQWTDNIEKEMAKRTERAAKVIRDQVRKNIGTQGSIGHHSKPGQFPFRQKGELQSKVKTRLGKRSPYTFTVYDTARHSKWLEYDTTGGKIIVPKRAKVLSFIVNGQRVFAKRVRQGAIKGRSFMRRTLVECRSKIKAIYVRKLPGRSGVGSSGAVIRVG